MGLVEGDPEGAKYLSAFQEALRDLGWRDGQNVQIDFRATAEDPLQMAKLADALPLERTASRRIVSNDPYEQVEGIRPCVELGFRHLVFHALGPDQARSLRPYSE